MCQDDCALRMTGRPLCDGPGDTSTGSRDCCNVRFLHGCFHIQNLTVFEEKCKEILLESKTSQVLYGRKLESLGGQARLRCLQ